VTTEDRTGVHVGTQAGTVGRAGLGAAICVVDPGPGSSSSASCSRSDGEAVYRPLVDVQIRVHKVGDNLPDLVTDWHHHRVDNQSLSFTSRMRLRITQDRKKQRVSMDRVRSDGTKPAERFSFLRRFVRACKDGNIWEGKALDLVGSFLTGSAATRFK